MQTEPMTVNITHTVTASQTEYSDWNYTHGYDKVDVRALFRSK